MIIIIIGIHNTAESNVIEFSSSAINANVLFKTNGKPAAMGVHVQVFAEPIPLCLTYYCMCIV